MWRYPAPEPPSEREHSPKYCRRYYRVSRVRAELAFLQFAAGGEMLRDTPRATGAKGIGTSAVVPTDSTMEPETAPRLADLGITRDESSRAQLRFRGFSDLQQRKLRARDGSGGTGGGTSGCVRVLKGVRALGTATSTATPSRMYLPARSNLREHFHTCAGD